MAVHCEMTLDHTLLVSTTGDTDAAHTAKLLKASTMRWKSLPSGHISAPATWPTMVQLTSIFGDELETNLLFTQEYAREAERRLRPAHPNWGRLTGGRPYQREAASIIANMRKVLLADDPGVGKTISALLGVGTTANQNPWAAYPCVVICPAALVDHWVEATKLWLTKSVVAWRGTHRRHLTAAKVYVTSYETAARDCGNGPHSTTLLYDLLPATVIIDECHKIKNPRTQQSIAVRRLAKGAETVIALSGTPITRTADDIWGTLNALDPVSWPSRTRWVERYCDTYETPYATEVIGLKKTMLHELERSLLGNIRRVTKAEVLSELPPKVYTTHTVELPQKWRKIYDDLSVTMLADEGRIAIMDPLELILRLVQLSNSACEVEKISETGPDGPRTRIKLHPVAPWWKIDAMVEALTERREQQVLVFAPFRELLLAAKDAYEKHCPAGHTAGLIIGGQTARGRTATVDAFQAGKHNVLFSTLQAGGTGLTLTAASTVLFLQRPWDYVAAVQAEDRAHRIGSERHSSIEILDIVAKDTFDQTIHRALTRKGKTLDSFFSSIAKINTLIKEMAQKGE